MRQRYPRGGALSRPAATTSRQATRIIETCTQNLDTAEARSRYESLHFGRGFVEEVKQNYALARVEGRYFVYRPRSP